MSGTQQEVLDSFLTAYDTAADFFGVPTVAAQLAAKDAALANAQGLLTAANNTVATLQARLNSVVADADAAIAADQKIKTDAGG